MTGKSTLNRPGQEKAWHSKSVLSQEEHKLGILFSLTYGIRLSGPQTIATQTRDLKNETVQTSENSDLPAFAKIQMYPKCLDGG